VRAYPVQPGVPAAGHVSARGFWHPGRVDGCVKCDTRASITCPVCSMTSYHPRDIAEGYCGNCHDWTSRK
jgi:hypothetical protein